MEGQKLGDYVVSSCIGSGSIGTVYKAIYTQTNHPVAIKQVPKTCPTIIDEINLMYKINHPFIVPLFEVMELPTHYFLVMEYVDGITLADFIKHYKGNIDEWLILHIFCQILSCLNYLHHELNHFHGDLKLENIMIDRSFNIRLLSFGLSESKDKNKKQDEFPFWTFPYSAPEVLKFAKYSQAGDIWNLGIIGYVLKEKRFPTTHEELIHFYHMEGLKQSSLHMMKDLVDIIYLCLNENANQRPQASTLTQAEWVRSYPNDFIFTDELQSSNDWSICHNDQLYIQIVKRARIVYEMGNLAVNCGCTHSVTKCITKQNSLHLTPPKTMKKQVVRKFSSKTQLQRITRPYILCNSVI